MKRIKINVVALALALVATTGLNTKVIGLDDEINKQTFETSKNVCSGLTGVELNVARTMLINPIPVSEIQPEVSTESVCNTIVSTPIVEGYYNQRTGQVYSEEEGILLAALVWSESRGCDDTHQTMVAQVVINRVESDKFPDTIQEVIYQDNPLQYACINNGQLEKALQMYNNPQNLSDAEYEVLERCLENVAYILCGNRLLDASVVYQAEFEQGSGVAYVSGNTYFCYE